MPRDISNDLRPRRKRAAFGGGNVSFSEACSFPLLGRYAETVNVLFICSRNRLRSPTAEALFAVHDGISTASAGTSQDSENVVSADLIEWADLIFAMEAVHKRRLNARYASLLKTRRVIVLGIPDKYEYMEDALVSSLNAKVLPHLK